MAGGVGCFSPSSSQIKFDSAQFLEEKWRPRRRFLKEQNTSKRKLARAQLLQGTERMDGIMKKRMIHSAHKVIEHRLARLSITYIKHISRIQQKAIARAKGIRGEIDVSAAEI